MKCSNCGAELNENDKVCSECNTEVVEPKKERKYILNNEFDFIATVIGCLNFIWGVILKPVTDLKSKIDDYSDIKKTGILVLLVSLARMIINLISSMISVIFMKEVNFWTGATKFTVSFERLKNLKYFDLIFKQFFGFIIVVAAVAGVYYIVSLIMKRNANYIKLVAIATVSFVPFIILSFASVLVSYIYAPASLFLIISSFVYSIFTFIIGINNEIDFENSNFKVYFHTICLIVLFILYYYILNNNSFSLITGLLK